MCGIAGFSGDFERSALERASAALAHRGPDDAGTFVHESGVGLAHRRLSIIDLSAEACQPMASADARLVVVFNGEIYNYRELRNELLTGGAGFRTQSDTEVILAGYQRWGEAVLDRLDGIFAFALWDAGRDRVLLARDALGVKPLYYAATREGVAFGSEIKALVALAPSIRELDPAAIRRYLMFLWCPGEETPFRGVRKLGPGEAMSLRHGRIERQWAWYEPPFRRQRGAPVGADEAVGGARDRLRSAVHRQLVSDVPVGAFLSGGLDSSAVVAFAREKNPAIHCFTIAPADGRDPDFSDDLPYAKRVAGHLGVPLEVVPIDAAGMAADLDRMVWQLDEPLADPAPLNVLYISQLARDRGIKVLLSGAGGDDLFSGYRRHAGLVSERYWRWLPEPVLAAAERGTRRLDQRRATGRRLRKLFSGATLTGDARIASYFAWIPGTELDRLAGPALREDADPRSDQAPMLDYLASLTPDVEPLDRMLALEQRFFLPDHNLTYTDKMSMAAGVEVRVPFLDRELVEFAARIPPELKQRGTTGKYVLKRALESELPREVVHRSKAGFGAPLRRWLRHELVGMVDDVLSPETIKGRGLFDPTAVRALVERDRTGQVDASYTVLGLVCLELWCRHFVDRTAPPATWRGRSPAIG